MHDLNGDRDWTWRAEADEVRHLRDLVGHRHVVETLDALSHGPMTVAQMTRQHGVGRRGVTAALRVIAARGLVSSSRAGSWDAAAARDTRYCLNDRGLAVIATLSRLSIWTVLVDGCDLDGRPDRQRHDCP
jgi:DNA-binding transcriptional ArsR family regulator